MTTEEVQTALERAIANPQVRLSLRTPYRPTAIPAPLDSKIMGPATKLAAEHFPGIPMIPIMLTGATDATMVGLLGIPVYGVPGLFFDADGGGARSMTDAIICTGWSSFMPKNEARLTSTILVWVQVDTTVKHVRKSSVNA
jgi:hypothetical protein